RAFASARAAFSERIEGVFAEESCVRLSPPRKIASEATNHAIDKSAIQTDRARRGSPAEDRATGFAGRVAAERCKDEFVPPAARGRSSARKRRGFLSPHDREP